MQGLFMILRENVRNSSSVVPKKAIVKKHNICLLEKNFQSWIIKQHYCFAWALKFSVWERSGCPDLGFGI